MRWLDSALASRGGALACMLAMWAASVLGPLWTPWVSMNSDTAYYLALGRSLARGEGYRIDGVPHRAYPPVFPAMLAAVDSPARAQYGPEKLLVVLASLGALLGSWWVFSQRFAGRRRLALALLMASCPIFVRMSGLLMSDIPFLFFTMVFVAASDRFWREREGHWLSAVVSLAALALAALTRLAGLFFYLGVVAWLLRPSLWRRCARRCALFCLLFVGIALPPLVAWGAWVSSHAQAGSATYGDFIREDVLDGHSPFSFEGARRLAVRAVGMAYRQMRAAGQAIVGYGLGPVSGGLRPIVLALVLIGFLRRMRDPWPQEYCFATYAALTLLWPHLGKGRLWLPVAPLMLAYLPDGVDRLAGAVARLAHLRDEAARRLWAALPVAGLAVLFAGGALDGVESVRRTWVPSLPPVRNVVLGEAQLDIARFVLGLADRPVRLAYVRHLELVRAVADELTEVVRMPLREGMEPQAALRLLRENGITHLALGEEPEDMVVRARPEAAARALVAALPEQLPLVHSTANVRICRVLPLTRSDSGAHSTIRGRGAP
ncbi:MAG: hypothetical protein FJ290_29500 [Planctomycetes bacterium]|nr:hypothetical protein [Planctomycetota bacterium]